MGKELGAGGGKLALNPIDCMIWTFLIPVGVVKAKFLSLGVNGELV